MTTPVTTPAIEKRRLDGSKLQGTETPEQLIDWDTDLGGPVVHVPADQSAPPVANPKEPAKVEGANAV